MIGRLIGGAGLAMALGIFLLRWIAGRPGYHRLIQQQVAPGEDADSARRIAQALGHSLVGPEPSIAASWRRFGAPEDALVDRAIRHLGEVRVLLARMRLVAFAAAVAALSAIVGTDSPHPVLRSGGWLSIGCSLLGIAGSAGAFSGLFQAYHDRAYDNDDWQLPDDALLARLYPERFYQLAATGWFALWGLIGLASLALDHFIERPADG